MAGELTEEYIIISILYGIIPMWKEYIIFLNIYQKPCHGLNP